MDDTTRVLSRQRRGMRVKRVGAAVMELRLWWCCRVLPVLGSMLGLGCLVVMAFTISVTIGLGFLAAAFVIAEWRVRG